MHRVTSADDFSRGAVLLASALVLFGCHGSVPMPMSCADGGDVACAHLNDLEPRDDACWRCINDDDAGHYCRVVEGDTTCDPMTSCDGDEECDDGLFCNGIETCTDSICEHSGNPCTEPTPACDETIDSCVMCVTDADCDNEVFCDGEERCSGNGCFSAGEDPCEFAPALTCSESSDRCLPPSRSFVTNGTTSLPIGQLGTAAYEQAARECRESGRSALGPHFNALPWFSVPGRAPVDVLLPLLGTERIFVLPDHQLVAQNWNDLTDGDLVLPIDVMADQTQAPREFAWTGTNTAGEATGDDCGGWTLSSGSSATIGDYRAADADWTEYAAGGCEDAGRYYCFEVFPQEFEVKRVFLTSSQYTPTVHFSSVEDAREICQTLGREAVDDESTQWDVWMSYDDSAGTPDPEADPFGRFTRHDGPYVSLNNHLVALDFDDLVDGDLIDRIDVDEEWVRHDGADDIFTWTGTYGNGTSTPYDCAGWASNDPDDRGVYGTVTAAGKWWSESGDMLACNTPARFYCIEQ